ncbi:MAG: hypothetical protein IPI22_14090 [Bacteroidetes bacterium]|nr:hypothetical protein [Bacteroidota bacterium]
MARYPLTNRESSKLLIYKKSPFRKMNMQISINIYLKIVC